MSAKAGIQCGRQTTRASLKSTASALLLASRENNAAAFESKNSASGWRVKANFWQDEASVSERESTSPK